MVLRREWRTRDTARDHQKRRFRVKMKQDNKAQGSALCFSVSFQVPVKFPKGRGLSVFIFES